MYDHLSVLSIFDVAKLIRLTPGRFWGCEQAEQLHPHQ
jgi:hypothetical protein